VKADGPSPILPLTPSLSTLGEGWGEGHSSLIVHRSSLTRALVLLLVVIFAPFARAQSLPTSRPEAVEIREIPNAAVQWKSFMDQDDAGFTVFPKGEGRRFVFMSQSEGNDANDGLTDQTPIQTLSRAIALMRNGYPDRLLLKRGDVFRAKNFNTVFSRGGRSVLEPMMIATYGDPHLPRPIIACNLALGGRYQPNFLVIQDLDFYADMLDPDSPNYNPHAKDIHQGEGINMLAIGKYLWIENCRFRDLGCALELQTGRERYHGLIIRRCIIQDDFSTGSHSQGIYLYNVEDVLIEEDLFDHNGWNDHDPDAGQTIFNHNMYIQHGKWGETFNVIVRNNISARASSHGCQLRPGGVLENNLFLDNPLAAFVAYSASIVRNNVVMGGRAIGKDPRGKGIDAMNCPAVLFEGNIIAHKNDPVNSMPAFGYNPLLKEAPADDARAEYRKNIVYDWSGAALDVQSLGQSLWVHDNYFDTHDGWIIALGQFDSRVHLENNRYISDGSDPFTIAKQRFNLQDWLAGTADTSTDKPLDFVDPSRDIASYAKSIGLPDASAEGFLNAARQQCRGHWDPRLTAAAVNDYIRAGFAVKDK
jgi:hypothetical protein